MTIIYFKELKYDGKAWKVPVPITISETSVSANTDTTIFTPSAGFSVLNITITDTSGASNTITIKDGTTTVKAITLSANSSTTLSGVVIKNSLVVRSSGACKVFITGEDYQELIE